MSRVRLPASTYRLQVTEDFDLLDAARTLTYLHDLGVDWVYLSPVLASESGSDHGYDVADHRAIDPSRGRASGLSALATEARPRAGSIAEWSATSYPWLLPVSEASRGER